MPQSNQSAKTNLVSKVCFAFALDIQLQCNQQIREAYSQEFYTYTV